MDKKFCTSTALIAFTLLGVATASNDHKHKHDSDHNHAEHKSGDDDQSAQQAHVHGAWELFAALDDKQLSITIKGPLVDAIGFEHTPVEKTEFDAVKNLQENLTDPQKLVALSNRSKCELTTPAQIVLPIGFTHSSAESTPKTNKDDDTSHHDHDKGHDTEHDHDENDDHDAHGEHEEHDIHKSDLEIKYVFDCKTPKHLKEISVTAFETFPEIESINAVFLGASKQSADQLNAKTPILKLD